jgi:hypothetical protein
MSITSVLVILLAILDLLLAATFMLYFRYMWWYSQLVVVWSNRLLLSGSHY